MAKKTTIHNNPSLDNRDIEVSKEELDELLKKMMGIKSYPSKNIQSGHCEISE